jgi:hypothetical protein
MGVISTQGFQFRLLAGSDPATQLDLFKDEDIKLSNNVTGIFDIGVLPADFSRQITLPGTKVNNGFFEHVYDISIDSPFLFATNIKVPCYFDFGGFYLSNGYLQLNKVNVIANKFIDSYEVTIYGALSSFGRDINRAYLTDLTSLSKFNHTASYDNIVQSWDTGSGGLFSGSIVYPLADYGQGWQFTPSNLYTGIDSNEGSLNTMDFKPAIRVKEVWDAIFEYAGYTYSSSFWQEEWLDGVYMMCNNALKYPEFAGYDLETLGLAKISPFSGSGQTDLVVAKNTATNLPWYNVESDPSNVVGNNSSYTITLDHNSSLSGILNLNLNLSGSLGAPVIELLVRETGSLSQLSLTTMVEFNQFFQAKTYEEFAAGNTGQNTTTQVQQNFRTSIIPPGTYYFGIQWRDQFLAPYNNFKFTLDPGGSPKSYLQITKVNQAADGLIMNIPLNMPYGTTGIKLIDFISGIQKKFNLVIYPNNTNQSEFIVETFNTWYNKGQKWDFNKYINLDEKIEIIPANNFAVNKLNFGDTLDQDYISQQFAKGANREYGKIYYTDTTNFYSQGTYEVKTTFSSEPLVYLQGTGLSGSVGGFNPQPVAYQLPGQYAISAYAPNPVYACNSIANNTIFSSTGVLENGAILYFDAYGASPLTGYDWIIDYNTCEVFQINPVNALATDTGNTCTHYGYPCQ